MINNIKLFVKLLMAYKVDTEKASVEVPATSQVA
jgi:hypothetical protein